MNTTERDLEGRPAMSQVLPMEGPEETTRAPSQPSVVLSSGFSPEMTLIACGCFDQTLQEGEAKLEKSEQKATTQPIETVDKTHSPNDGKMVRIEATASWKGRAVEERIESKISCESQRPVAEKGLGLDELQEHKLYPNSVTSIPETNLLNASFLPVEAFVPETNLSCGCFDQKEQRSENSLEKAATKEIIEKEVMTEVVQAQPSYDLSRRFQEDRT